MEQLCKICGGPHLTGACNEESVESIKERLKSPYFIREATLEQTLAKLKELDPLKRKIIVYVGVHPHEETDKLSVKYATAWAEKYGATVVCQPTEETPQAIWAKHKKETEGDLSTPLPTDTILDEEYYGDKFSLENNDTFFIQFHGTPLNVYQQGASARKPGLDIEISRYANHPKDFQNRKNPVTFSKPKITDGLQEAIQSSKKEQGEAIENKVFEEVYDSGPRTRAPHGPNTLLVEYFYTGKPVNIDDPYINSLLEREDEADKKFRAEMQKYADGLDMEPTEDMVYPLSKENWYRQMNIGPFYLTQDKLSDEDITRFDKVVVKDFEKILEHISKQL